MHHTNRSSETDSVAPEQQLSFDTHPDRYRHWKLQFGGPVAQLCMNVDESGGQFSGYELKKNSYDIGVDIELYDAVQRLRFEHPEVRTVVLTSALPGMFCAGANIGMLGGSTHGHKVNFCKFTNETRNSIEDASEYSGQRYLAALNGTAAGGGYELAMAADHILLIDDASAAVSLPEVPLLAVLPGTGGLTRLVDKRKVRRDLADVFCTLEEGIKGQRAVDWRLVDEIAPSSQFSKCTQDRALAMAAFSDRPADAKGFELAPLEIHSGTDQIEYEYLKLEIDRDLRVVTLIVNGPGEYAPESLDDALGQGVDFWPLAVTRQLDHALLHLRFNEPELGSWVFKTEGVSAQVLSFDEFLGCHKENWFIREVILYLKRTFKRIDVSSRTVIALIEPGSCFAGFISEFGLAADRAYMLDGQFEKDERPEAEIVLTKNNFDLFPMANRLSRVATRFYGDEVSFKKTLGLVNRPLLAQDAMEAGLVTFAPDDIDWDDEVRMLLEERSSFSPDALTGMEANLRFPGPETMETKIFGRLTAWQNWIFQRPNAVGDAGALRSYGTGKRAEFDRKRV